MFETGNQFVAGDGRSAEFANDNRAGVVCDLGSFQRGCAASEGESEYRNRRVPGA
jgi:hypothetical protein